MAEHKYRVMVMVRSSIFGAAEITAPLPKKEANEECARRLEEGLCATAFAVDSEGKALNHYREVDFFKCA